MKVVEIFRSIQGEGLLIGTPMLFIRLAGCNLRCPYCDTKYAWYGGEDLGVEDIVTRVAKVADNLTWVAVTGGEPLLQQDELAQLVRQLNSIGFSIVIETNGTLIPLPDLLDASCIWSISPKLPSFNPSYPLPPPINSVIHKLRLFYYKIVVTDLKDIELVENIVPRGIPKELIILQPNHYTITYEELIKYVLSKRLPYRVLPQLHKWIGID